MSKIAHPRTVLCSRCDAALEVSTLTKSFTCPPCGRVFRTEDEVVTDYQARVEYFNEGRVEVAKKGIIVSDVRVGDLALKGEVRGPVRARRSVAISKTGKLFGNVTCRTFSMEEGAQLIGHVAFGPGS